MLTGNFVPIQDAAPSQISIWHAFHIGEAI